MVNPESLPGSGYLTEEELLRRYPRLVFIRSLVRFLDGTGDGPVGWLGADALLGLVPVGGDTITLVLSGWIVYEAIQHGVPRAILEKMAWNLAQDYLVGLIPGVGDLFDAAFKANRMNYRLLLDHLRSRHPKPL